MKIFRQNIAWPPQTAVTDANNYSSYISDTTATTAVLQQPQH